MNINEAHGEAERAAEATYMQHMDATPKNPASTGGEVRKEGRRLSRAAYLAAMEAAGFVMMPVEATAEMGREGSAARNKGALVEGIYTAMVAARPRVTP